MQNHIVKLDGGDTTVIVRVSPHAEIVYWGSRLTEVDPDFVDTLTYPVPNGRIDVTAPLTLSPEQGRGMFSSPGLEGHRRGQDWAPIFTATSHQHHEDDGRLLIHCVDDIAKLTLDVELRLDPDSGVLGCRHHLGNQGEVPYSLQRLAVTLPLPDRAAELMAFHGRWLQEFQTHRLAIPYGGYLQESRRGRHHEYFPAMIAGTPHFTETRGEVWGAHLAWSGDHRIRIDTKSDGRRFLQAEALYQAGEIEIAGNATHATPWLYASYGAEGLNAMSEHLHRFVRTELLQFPVETQRPVQLNIWEGVYFDHDPEYIMRMAEAAQRLGIERFIVDDGWFRGRADDYAGLGDWYLDETKYPQGFTPVVEHVHRLGMQFGLWFEPEMVNPDSDLFRAHPDWVLGLAGYDQPTGRHQYALDLCNSEVFDYLLERLDTLLAEYSIDYVKWDMNRDLIQASHLGQASSHAQTERLYALFEELRKRHPATEFESCASGGGRIDYGILRYVQRFWASDSNDALERQHIQRGMSYFFPPEVMGAHVGAERCHSSLRRHDLGFRALTALPGHMGAELDPLTLSEQQFEQLRHYISLHKEWRALLHSGRSVRLETADAERLQAQAVIGDEAAIVIVAQLATPSWAMNEALRIPYLHPSKRYRVTVLDRPEAARDGSHTMRYQVPWMAQESIEATGAWLSEAGLRLPQMDPESALLIKLEVI